MPIRRTPANESQLQPWKIASAHFPMREVTFSIPPPAVGKSSEDPKSLQLLYNQCHWTAFGRLSKPENLLATGVYLQLAKVLEKFPDKKRFILANMWGHRESKSEFKWQAKNLISQAATNRFLQFSKAASDAWGVNDSESLDRFFNNGEKCSTVIDDSEMAVARWIVGYKIGSGGPAWEPMIQALECKLHPLWLALEPCYSTLAETPVDLANLTADDKEVWQVRAQVSKWRVVFQSQKDCVASWCHLRNEVTASIIPRVLTHFGQSVDDYSVQHRTWKSSIDFWTKLGLALQHVAVAAVYRGEKSPLLRWLQKGGHSNF